MAFAFRSSDLMVRVMLITIPPEFTSFIRESIESGRLKVVDFDQKTKLSLKPCDYFNDTNKNSPRCEPISRWDLMKLQQARSWNWMWKTSSVEAANVCKGESPLRHDQTLHGEMMGIDSNNGGRTAAGSRLPVTYRVPAEPT